MNREVILPAQSHMPEEKVKSFDRGYNYPLHYFPIVSAMRDGEPATDDGTAIHGQSAMVKKLPNPDDRTCKKQKSRES